MDAVAWSGDRRLGWPDFQAEFDPAAQEDARSSIRFRPEWTIESDESDGAVVFFVRDLRLCAEFLPTLSWVRPAHQNDGLLLHEQGRFDLAELVGREAAASIQDDLGGRHYPTRGKNEDQRQQNAKEDSGEMIAPKIEGAERVFEERSAEYDRQTEFGRNRTSQSTYDGMFAKLRT